MSLDIHLAILVADKERADLAIEDLWRTAKLAVPDNVRLTGTAVYAAIPGAPVLPSEEFLDVTALALEAEGPIARLVNLIAAKAGPIGILGRLVQHNLQSHQLARALAKNRGLIDIFCAASMVVSADPLADWAIWSLRKKSTAPLLHGPFAMSNTLAEMARK